MTDADKFWKDFDDCQAQVRAEIIAHRRVVSLRPDMTVEQRAIVAIEAFTAAMEGLDHQGNSISASAETIGKLEGCARSLALLLGRLRMRQGLMHLTGIFGKAP